MGRRNERTGTSTVCYEYEYEIQKKKKRGYQLRTPFDPAQYHFSSLSLLHA